MFASYAVPTAMPERRLAPLPTDGLWWKTLAFASRAQDDARTVLVQMWEGLRRLLARRERGFSAPRVASGASAPRADRGLPAISRSTGPTYVPRHGVLPRSVLQHVVPRHVVLPRSVLQHVVLRGTDFHAVGGTFGCSERKGPLQLTVADTDAALALMQARHGLDRYRQLPLLAACKHTPCDPQRAACNVQHTMCNMQPSRIPGHRLLLLRTRAVLHLLHGAVAQA